MSVTSSSNASGNARGARLRWLACAVWLVAGCVTPLTAHAAAPDGATLPAWWGVPFAGMLLSIALFPMLAAHVWHRHFGKIAATWALLFLLPFGAVFGAGAALGVFLHALVEEYLPFILLLTALYTVAGGICVRGELHATPRSNVAMLALGTVLASVMGTTGAAMLLIRPLIRANHGRSDITHVMVFFIFLVANVGGSLTPLGDPPLFLGFLNGVGFFWTTRHLVLPMLCLCGALLALFYALDTYRFSKGGVTAVINDEAGDYVLPEGSNVASALDVTQAVGHHAALRIDGKINFVLLAAVIALVLMSGLWQPGVHFTIGGARVELQNLVRDAALVVVTLLSLAVTPHSARAGNDFDWAPIDEVAKLFAGIFVTIAPVILILRAGEAGAFAGIVHLVNDTAGNPRDAMYFWTTGLLSSFLDNAPTYLVFFNLAGGDAQQLTTTGATTLTAISAGAVFMGANSYIGNAPNFMVKAIAEARGVRMPGFFGYVGWAACVLLPLYAVLTWLFF